MPAAGAGRGDEVDRLTGLWSALTAFTKSPGAWRLDPKRRAALAARVKEYDEATVLRVARWVNESSHDRARFLKERGDVKTLIRPENFATYAALSDGWTPGTAASTANLGDAASAARHLAATAINAAGSAVPEAQSASGAQFEVTDASEAATNNSRLISTVAGAAIPIGQVLTLKVAYVTD